MITEIIEKLKKFFEMREEVQFAILFGSLAKGIANKLSDIDIAVMVAPHFKDTFPYGYQAALTADLMQELKRNDVDVIILNKAPIALRYQVLRYGKFIHIQDKQARIQFQIDTINRYEDFKIICRVHEEAFHRRWNNPLPPPTPIHINLSTFHQFPSLDGRVGVGSSFHPHLTSPVKGEEEGRLQNGS